ncbi:hypothetical protein [Pseudomonas sp. UW4]|uniref:hypothetical protein n=1 Tax=Pseudomonas sp. UW4 TaxID=1207075 RepID=UPI0002EA3A35|nr:hypothetical protein [Pseudomonas sp. UW4]
MLTPGGGRGHASGRASGPFKREGDIITVKRMDNIGIVVEDIDAAIEFFTELGLELGQHACR